MTRSTQPASVEQQLDETLSQIEQLADGVDVSRTLDESRDHKAQSDRLVSEVDRHASLLALNAEKLNATRDRILLSEATLSLVDADLGRVVDTNKAVNEQLNSVRDAGNECWKEKFLRVS